MKRFLIITLIAFLAGIFNAEAESDATDTAPMFGVRAAFDVNIPGDWHNDSGAAKMYCNGYGVTLGGVYNIYLGKGFYFEPGVSFFYDSYSYDDLKITDDNGYLKSENPSQYKLGLRIPLVAGYTFNISDRFSMSVFTGPELSWALGGKIKVKNKELTGILPDKLFGDFQRRLDCAWKIGVGVPYNSFLISIDAAIGMTNLLKNKNVSFRENRVSVGMTYYF